MAVRKGDRVTQIAMKAFTLADLFKIAFSEPLTGPVVHRLEMATPEGPSTGGGKQAVQHLKLVPVDGNGATIVIGSANQMANSCDLRSFDYLRNMHAQRFKGARVPLDPVAYRELIARMSSFFSDRGMAVVIQAATPLASAPAPTAAESSHSASLITIAGAVIAFVLLVGAALFYVLHTRH